MPVYFMLLDGACFEEQIRPALSASWRQRSFEPCRALCSALVPAAQSYLEKYHVGPDEPLLYKFARHLPFDRDYWRLLVGEILLFAAVEIPEIQIAPEVLCCLLAPEHYRAGTVPRERFAPIQQAHFGARELLFGGKCYRPEYAGYNHREDVARLADYLKSQDPNQWTTADLSGFREVADEDERAEELAFARDWFPALCALYWQAREAGQVVVCEIL
jgi:hypothetical protein